MLKKIGRLDNEAKKEIIGLLDTIYNLLDDNKKAKAEKKLLELSATPNYFIREFVGKELINYRDQRKIMPIAKKMLSHRLYGIRATALFYFYQRYIDDAEKMIDILEDTFENVPWEAESIINEMWKRYPDLMKERMKKWVQSDNSKKRALSFHGMENIAHSDPAFIMEFISEAIDDDTMEVQKKITHILTQVARVNPIIVFPYIREWLCEANEKRIKTIWVSMKKLANIVIQKNRREKSQEFVLLTQQTINDWLNDENENVSKMGERLFHIIRS
ncbi:MAG: DNA alkylation repair protein [Candidatus Cloacimonetes bacterium]|nr:DNA alkylation repair protein [Candidatus Cloacimonadota bacterium]